MTILKSTIGDDAYKIIETGRYLLSETSTVKYKFLTENELNNSYQQSTKLGNKNYWLEIFYRCHMSSYSGLKRLLDWVSIIEQSSENFISYCSGLRGLMECAGDTYDGLSAIAITLGENKQVIKMAINGLQNEIVINQDLEDKLIHFTHASKEYAQTTKIKNHIPKKPYEYVRALENGSTMKFYEYYSFLCELTHPAGTSLGYNFDENDKNELFFNPSKDKTLVANSFLRDKDMIIEILMKGFNPITLLIKTINLFKIETMYSRYADKVVLNVPGWERITR